MVVISVLEAFANSEFKVVNVTNPSNCVDANGAENVIVCAPPNVASVIVKLLAQNLPSAPLMVGGFFCQFVLRPPNDAVS